MRLRRTSSTQKTGASCRIPHSMFLQLSKKLRSTFMTSQASTRSFFRADTVISAFIMSASN